MPNSHIFAVITSSPIPYQEVKRQRAAEAALRRQKDSESRGVKNPELLKEKQAKREALEKAQARANHGDNKLAVRLCCVLVLCGVVSC